MAFRAFMAHKAEHTHENSYFQEFYQELKRYYEDRDEDAVLVANPNIGGSRPDALFIKNDAMCVIDFKNYSGEFHFERNASWQTKGKPPIPIKGGSKKNPYEQCDHFRKKTEVSLKAIFPGRKNLFVNAMVLFHGGRMSVTNTLPNDVKKWFHIADKFDAINKIAALATPEFYLNEDDINYFLSKHGIKDPYILPSEVVAEKKAKEKAAQANAAASAPVIEQKLTTPAIAVLNEAPQVAPLTSAEQTNTPAIAVDEEPKVRQVAPQVSQAVPRELTPIDEAALAEAKNKLRAFVDESTKLSFWNEGSAQFNERADEPIYYPKNVEIPSEKYGYGPFNADKRPELLLFYYAVRAVVPENVDIDVVPGQYVEKYRFTDGATQESVVISFHYNKECKFFRNKAQCSVPGSKLAEDVLQLLSTAYAPQKIERFEGFAMRLWLETLSESMEKFFGAHIVEAKPINFGANFKWARGRESLTCQAYHKANFKISSILIQEYNSQNLFKDFKQLLT